ncbi:hypothetical protein [Achromobacter sp.]|uniref:hypothetical protein n=1 Tax=Achromobacter sp. TaxID=134375 RepID=UPI00289C0207|nr:hypothetical protein [Achromobacter sp.]
MAFSCFARQRFADFSMIDRRATGLAQPAAARLRQIRRRLMNQKQKSQPMKVGFLLWHYCPKYLLPEVFTTQITKTISLNYFCIAAATKALSLGALQRLLAQEGLWWVVLGSNQ